MLPTTCSSSGEAQDAGPLQKSSYLFTTAPDTTPHALTHTHTLWGLRRRVQLHCTNTAVPFLPAQQQHSLHSQLARRLLWTRSGNYRRFPKVWLMFQHLPITDCTLSHGRHVVGDPGIYSLVSTSWVPSLFFFTRRSTREISCRSEALGLRLLQ